MQWEFVVALVIAIPIVLFPAVFVWYLNIGGIVQAVREARQARAADRTRPETVKKVI
ncbi:MAG TPA: solute carrier organic anion transporter [Dehalococcoidia bacterium]|nr:solute carrier organic anion transporter [Dehalococcoidia bacterium]